MTVIKAQKLTKDAFSKFGQVIDKDCDEKIAINNGNCLRHHDLAELDFIGDGAKAIISIFAGQPYALPHNLNMMERHPLGSQAFIPMHDRPFLVCVSEDDNATPVNVQAFITAPNQGINLNRNIWHGVLTPLFKAGDFLVVDRGGEGDNLEECYFDEAILVEVDDKLLA